MASRLLNDMQTAGNGGLIPRIREVAGPPLMRKISKGMKYQENEQDNLQRKRKGYEYLAHDKPVLINAHKYTNCTSTS